MHANHAATSKQGEAAASRRRPSDAESELDAARRQAGSAPAPRAKVKPLFTSPAAILGLQRTIGNAAVSRMIQQSRPSAARPSNGPPRVQRMLMTHETKSDAGKQIDELGDVGFINDYARWLAKDGSVLAEGKPVGKAGLATTLKGAAVSGKKVQKELIDSVISSKSWKEVNEADKQSLVDYVRGENSDALMEQEDGETPSAYMDTWDFEGTYEDDIRAWIASKAKLTAATTVGGIASANLPLAWHTDLAYIVYEQTKNLYYPERGYTAFVPLFKQLITDVNAGEIEEFKFVRKYGAASNNWGAEFTAEKPTDMRDKYAGKAVLHTHYAAEDEAPNYAHTKPEEKKFEPGFGYTIVETSKVTGIDDTQGAWEDL